MSINIVLVEPEIPQNTGNIIRTCAATGARLHLVRPLGFSMDNKYLKRAGLDYWDLADVQYYDNLDELKEKNKNAKFFYSTTKTNQNHSDVKYEKGCFIVFGKETKGLPVGLLNDNKETCIRVPMRDIERARSLNLSNSVAIVAYEALRQIGYPDMR
ncbi:tRNA (uridine(34)/cytosine(34)/5-carboxymethylaminomethyluridine(34)-2'-O)-methyltransferase TrmL [Tepidibacter mesophilus]|uniref:tRNA (uridine(34)/cytosine(34)/5- carboxymethylaminomethyluridine(34)-2'-O)- methyltransferase TrmL n=1 Tax=Tepidibacter mesophilus TaxID=655607 RepID=UPI000C077392|nr:tRNA (uridine(34)/cytosine(34)/5-carboxymethylaminomethyluridine(34)-2'-O)-methyltransferase TrmL [Tepidibacter mesophilus]